jgi:dinuclear metal center YbgI/SA1388 family protein
MAHLSRIIEFLDTLLEPSKYNDGSYNGLQVDAGVSEVMQVAGAVDSGASIIEKAIASDADLLLVHHGLFWGNSPHVANGMHGMKIRRLIQHPCSLYASHLPLDGNLEVGNATEILRKLGVTNVHPFAFEGGMTLGARGELQTDVSIAEITHILSRAEGYGPEVILPFGAQKIKSIGVCTGAGGFAIHEARRLNLDLFISGEPKHHQYHEAKELGQSALFFGHYASETYGIKALLKLLETTFGVKTIWISEPTGI